MTDKSKVEIFRESSESPVVILLWPGGKIACGDGSEVVWEVHEDHKEETPPHGSLRIGRFAAPRCVVDSFLARFTSSSASVTDFLDLGLGVVGAERRWWRLLHVAVEYADIIDTEVPGEAYVVRVMVVFQGLEVQ